MNQRKQSEQGILPYINEENKNLYNIYITLNKLPLLSYDIFSKLNMYKLWKCLEFKINLKEVEESLQKAIN